MPFPLTHPPVAELPVPETPTAPAGADRPAGRMHTLHYTVQDNTDPAPRREVVVHAAPEQLRHLDERGYWLREGMFAGDDLDALRAALDEAGEQARQVGEAEESTSGYFVRALYDRHPYFLKMLRFEPTLSVARAMLGPRVAARAMVGRVCPPGSENVGVGWHIHQRVIPTPQPRWFAHPHGLDALVYLDDTTDENGPLAVLPGSHRDLAFNLPQRCMDELAGEVTLRPRAGDCLFMHPNLWHKALPASDPASGTRRRLLILGYCPTWLKDSALAKRKPDGLSRRLVAAGDPEDLELLGLAGWS